MKKLLLTAITLFSFIFCYTQDLITKKSGDTIQAKIIEVGQTELKYKKFDNQNGPVYIISKSDILSIRYENGTKEDFNKDKQLENTSSSSLSNEDFFKKGYTDASIYYKGYKGAGTGTFLVSFLVSPLIGLIPAIACSSTAPKDKNLRYPNTELMKNTEYYHGYTLRAKKIKQGKVWLNWGIAFGINIALEVILLSAH